MATRHSKSSTSKAGRKAKARPVRKAKAKPARKAKPVRKTKPAPKARKARASRDGGKIGSASSDTELQPVSPVIATEEDIERWLATGERRGQLEDYFGPDQLRELEELAREGMRSRVRGGPRVLILPGIMGSKLGKRRKLLPDDVVWVDPLDTAAGRLGKLALPDQGKFEALGVMLFAYLKLKLRLRIAGFDASFFAFDWRQSIARLGATLAKEIAACDGNVSLVAHSMGGLVSRAALTHSAASAKVSKLIMLGTPNFGSFSPVQALRAEHSLASKIAAVDLAHSSTYLSEKLFATFPGLIEMLPSPERWSGIDLYRASEWPGDKPVPSQASLASARRVQSEALADADGRFYLIAGVNQETVVDFVVEDGKGFYESSREGDGTVPLALCELPNARTYYVEESHGSLANNGTVEAAVIDLLRNGATTRLPEFWTRPPTRARRKRFHVEPRRAFEGRSGALLTSADRRCLLEEFVSPASRSQTQPSIGEATAAPPGPGLPHHIRNVEVTRRRAHAVEICLAQGSITEARTRALALGVFRGVDPAGAAGAIDERLDGALKEAVTRRMFSAEIGSVFVIPVGRHLLYADNVVFAGLGPFDTFNPDAQQFVAENTLRLFVRSNVEDFATVLVGAGSGWSVPTALANQLRGYVRGIVDTDHDHRLRRITICELDLDRYREIKEEVYRLASTELFDDLVVTFDETVLGEPPIPPATRSAVLSQDADLAYLIVNREENPNPRGAVTTEVVYRASVLTRGNKATVISGSCRVEAKKLDDHLTKLEGREFNSASLKSFGEDLGQMVLESTVLKVLKEMKNSHLVVVHDAVSSRIPWETLSIDGWAPAAAAGLSRRYAAENLSAAKWLEERRQHEILHLLLISNPTGDLDGADEEAERVRRFFPSSAAVRINDTLHRERATREAILEELGSGKYDVVHYAGHAFFDPQQRARSGIICAGNQVLSGAQLAELRCLPTLAFFNACEAGRVRGTKDRKDRSLDIDRRVERNVGLAEAFLRGGIANYIGTYWPVGDKAAEEFATTFYGQLVIGKSLGSAIQAGRGAVRKIGSIDWANYVHYGSQDFSIKVGK